MASLSNPFSEFAKQVIGAIDDALERALPSPPGCPQQLRDALEYSLLAPGKRLRPTLVLLATDACGGEVQDALAPACAVEMIHAYSLVHDDLPAMDDDDMRRGRPSCHAKFGEATAILVGDALQALAFETVAAGLPLERAARACRELGSAAGAAALVGGQFDDLQSEGRPGTLELLQAIHARKTGALIRVSLRLGAIAAGAQHEHIEALDRFGERVGAVFQITDDLLDAESTTDQMGKRTQKDAERGKLTYPRLLGVEESRRHAETLTAEACQQLSVLGAAAERLHSLAQFVLERTR